MGYSLQKYLLYKVIYPGQLFVWETPVSPVAHDDLPPHLSLHDSCSYLPVRVADVRVGHTIPICEYGYGYGPYVAALLNCKSYWTHTNSPRTINISHFACNGFTANGKCKDGALWGL